MYKPLNVLGLTPCLFLTVRMDSPSLLHVLHSHWLIRLLLFLPLRHRPIRGTTLRQSFQDWPAVPWCCWLCLRSSLDCSDSFFNGNRSAVFLQHVWLSISQFCIQFCFSTMLWSFVLSLNPVSWFVTVINPHHGISPLFYSWSLAFNPSVSHFSIKKKGKSEPCVAWRWVHSISVYSVAVSTVAVGTLSFFCVVSPMQQVVYVPHMFDWGMSVSRGYVVKTSRYLLRLLEMTHLS